MRDLILHYLSQDDGQGLTEYALLLGVISIVALLAGFAVFFDSISGSLSNSAASLFG